jgi:hypothetical protein
MGINNTNFVIFLNCITEKKSIIEGKQSFQREKQIEQFFSDEKYADIIPNIPYDEKVGNYEKIGFWKDF